MRFSLFETLATQVTNLVFVPPDAYHPEATAQALFVAVADLAHDGLSVGV
jgi:hypothetical protein